MKTKYNYDFQTKWEDFKNIKIVDEKTFHEMAENGQLVIDDERPSWCNHEVEEHVLDACERVGIPVVNVRELRWYDGKFHAVHSHLAVKTPGGNWMTLRASWNEKTASWVPLVGGLSNYMWLYDEYNKFKEIEQNAPKKMSGNGVTEKRVNEWGRYIDAYIDRMNEVGMEKERRLAEKLAAFERMANSGKYDVRIYGKYLELERGLLTYRMEVTYEGEVKEEITEHFYRRWSEDQMQVFDKLSDNGIYREEKAKKAGKVA